MLCGKHKRFAAAPRGRAGFTDRIIPILRLRAEGLAVQQKIEGGGALAREHHAGIEKSARGVRFLPRAPQRRGRQRIERKARSVIKMHIYLPRGGQHGQRRGAKESYAEQRSKNAVKGLIYRFGQPQERQQHNDGVQREYRRACGVHRALVILPANVYKRKHAP